MSEIWLTRHGQTDWNKHRLMQGRSDIALNDIGVMQAKAMREKIDPIHFDRVYASPLQRAKDTACIIADVKEEDIIIDERIIEADFGPYEKKNYRKLGLPMTMYWTLPWFFDAPEGTESIESMKERASSFLDDLHLLKNERVLVVCHGGIMRVLSGLLSHHQNQLMWYPKPHNCEMRIFSVEERKMLKRIR